MKPRSKHRLILLRILLGLASVWMVWKLAITYPVAMASKVTVNVLLIAPSAFVFGIAYLISPNRNRTTIVVFLGIFLRWLVSPIVHVSWSDIPIFWDVFRVNFWNTGMFMLAGAILAAMVDFAITLIQSMLATVPPDN